MDGPGKVSRTFAKKSKVGSKSESAFNSSESLVSRICHLELSKFCPKKLFYIVLLFEDDDAKSIKLLDEITNVSKEYEEISSVTIITKEDVLQLLETDTDCVFPNQVKPLLLEVIENFDKENEFEEIQLLKLKLIQVMYQQYIKEVKRNEKECILENLLNSLSKECRKKQKKDDGAKQDGSEKHKKEEVKKPKKEDKTKGSNKEEEIDYTMIPVNHQDGISYEDDIFQYISFYCIKGYRNYNSIFHLINNFDVQVSAVLQISNDNTEFILEGNPENTSLENTIFMKFVPHVHSGTILEQFVFALRKIVNLQLMYFNYLRHLEINQWQYVYRVLPVDCLQQYNSSLINFDLECLNNYVMVSALLNELSYRIDDKTPSIMSVSRWSTSSKSIICDDPLRNINVISSVKMDSTLKALNHDKNKDFLVNERDELTKILKSYKKTGPEIARITLDLIKKSSVFNEIDVYSQETDDVIHLHDIDPGTEKIIGNNAIENFLYLFLFNNFANRCKLETSKPPVSYSLIENLITFDWTKFVLHNQVLNQHQEHIEIQENLYDTSIMHYRWRENFQRNVLIQEILAAATDFLYYHVKYSPETDNYIVVFSDELDSFGVNTKAVNKIVRTPVCFRDFCQRLVIEDEQWIQNNIVEIDEKTFRIVFESDCPGRIKIKKHLKMFQEYAYLLDNEDDPPEDFETEDPSEATKITIGDVLADLVKPISAIAQIIEEGKDKEKYAYNFGSSLFKLYGKIVTFSSHDNVKITADNTGFNYFPKKCSFKVSSYGNALIVHSAEHMKMEDYLATLVLADDTRITFVILKKTRNKEKDIDNAQEDKGLDIASSVPILVEDDANKKEDIPEKTPSVQDTTSHSLSTVDVPEQVQLVEEDFLQNILTDDIPINRNQSDLLTSLLTAKEQNGVVYKITKRLNHLKRKNSNLQLPLEHALGGFLPTTIKSETPKPYQTHTKRYGSFEPCSMDIKHPVDFRICLPNGLYIRAHQSTNDKNGFLIKQEYIEVKPNVPKIQHEEFRLFSNQGFVLIKKVDGTVTIFKANGDIINFEKLDSQDFGDTIVNGLRPCHCSTIKDYRNKINKLLSDERNSDFSASRRAHVSSKQNHIVDPKILDILQQFDVPYLKKSIIKCDGTYVKIQGNKIVQKQLYHVTHQPDFSTGEILNERNDDFRKIDRNGSWKIEFPDGTVICESIETTEDVYGFVYVKLDHQFEHPYYATVKFDFDKAASIILPNGTIFEESTDGFSVKMDRGLSLDVTNSKIRFAKNCPDCSGEFSASFDIRPFSEGYWKPDDTFMKVQDSYQKQFMSDFLGNCSRNDDYIKGSLNAVKCNHLVRTNYKKLFVVNRDLTGFAFRTNDYVKTKINDQENLSGSSVETYNIASKDNVTVVDCRRNHYTRYSDRYYNVSTAKKAYTTFRLFYKMFESVEELGVHIANIQKCSDLNSSTILDSIVAMEEALQTYYKKYEYELLAEEQEANEKKKKLLEEQEMRRLQEMKCSCDKQYMTMDEKMMIWKKTCRMYRRRIRNREFDNYFKSDFCKINK